MSVLTDFHKLLIMSILVSIYFLVELIVGYSLNSLALVADSFHMLSDLLSLVIAIASTRIARWPKSNRNTFGWQRAEVMGSLINSVMLASLCFVIIVEAIQRFFKEEEVSQPKLLFFVGLGGLLINFIGLIVLGVHSHSHGDHGHGHNVDDSELQDHPELLYKNSKSPGFDFNPETYDQDNEKGDFDAEHQYCHLKSCKIADKKSSNKKHSASLNMRAVFLHVMADFLGSVIVVISALVLWLVPDDEIKWKYYIDPILSLVLTAIILFPLIPLLIKSALILLQSVPDEICIKNLYNRLQNVEYVNHIHDLHVWQLGSECIIGTVHISVTNMSDYEKVVREVKQMFHEANVHCTTIQLEFQDETCANKQICVFNCPPMANCKAENCCPTSDEKVYSSSTSATTKNLNSSVGNPVNSLKDVADSNANDAIIL